jgi:NAD(P)-dependent dehydrogenase (short-subunit alcohol dehydrogenase family)
VDQFAGSVAVITGGAGGIGLALAEAAAARGAKIVLADIREAELALAERKLAGLGAEVLSVATDVANYASVAALAEKAISRFGKVNLLFNNAGVFASNLTWEASLEEYDWVIGINLKGVIHGIKAFVPRMIAQSDDCHVVNISSAAGLSVAPGFCTYATTKHAVIALSEALYLDLKAQNIGNIGVTIAMPGFVQSQIMQPEKTGPEALQAQLKSRLRNAALNAVEQGMRLGVASGMPASAMAELVFTAIQNNDLYVLPNMSDEDARARVKHVAVGRCTARNPYAAPLA